TGGLRGPGQDSIVYDLGDGDKDGLIYDNAGAPRGQRELERRRLERQCELRREPEQVE
ncbi:MAG: hypothetical protein RIQ72_309, partial [Candidatus Parcubacteria bacterium]